MPRKTSPDRSLLRALEATTSPVYLLDGQRRIIYGNPAFSRWVGRDVEQLVGVRSDYHASGEVSGAVELAAALCPPPDAFLGRLAAGSVAGPDRSRLAPRDEPGENAGLVSRSETATLAERSARFIQLPGDEGLLVIVDAGVAAAQSERGDAAQLAPEWLHSVLLRLRGELGRRFHIGQLIGESDAMGRVREQVRLAAEARTRVLVVGPTGSGREHVAKTIHYGQPAGALGPLVPIDCAIIDAELMQSTLTSILRRAAHSQSTDARPAKPAALLLNVDKLRADAQQELAGFLLLPGIELHALATARHPLQRQAAKGKFRRDLAYALSTLTIALPALKNRPTDIPLLAQFFLEEFNALGKRQLSGFAPPALDQLVTYSWPENVDELAQLVRQACEAAQGPQVTVADLPDRIHHAMQDLAHPPREAAAIQLDDFLAEIERELIERALRTARNNKTKAAQLLGVNRARLLRRLVQLGLAPPPTEEEPIVFEPLPDESP